jgi:hypothetical protein
VSRQLELTRIGIAEHAYPTPTRRILAEHNRERAKSRATRQTAAPVTHKRRRADGSVVTVLKSATLTDRQYELLDRQLAEQERRARRAERLAASAADVDHWSAHR